MTRWTLCWSWVAEHRDLLTVGYPTSERVAMALRPLAETRRARVRPFEGVTPVREVSFVRIREHLRRAIADAIVDALLAALPEDLAVKGTAAASRRQEVLAPLDDAAT